MLMKFTRIVLLASCAILAVAQQPPRKTQQPQSRDLTIEKIGTETTPTKTVTMPRSWAVIVGISRYKSSSVRPLQFSERDAQSIKTILINPEGGSFKEENVHLLLGSDATLDKVRYEIGTWLPQNAKEGDRALIYFAGHGFIDPNTGRGYLAPYDIDPNHFGSTGYPMDELAEVIGGKIHAKSKILLTDACHSGAISPEDTQNINHKLMDLNKSLFSLTASRDREVSYETELLEGGHGVFTYYLVEGLKGQADISPRDGIVTADELAEYVHTQVRDYTTKNAPSPQNPTSDQGSYDPAMLMSYAGPGVVPDAPAPKVGELVFGVNKDGVEVFLDGKSIGVLNKGTPVSMPGLQPGPHTVLGVKDGFESYGPVEVTVYPGGRDSVTVNILVPRHHKQEAMDLLKKGLKDYNDQDYHKAADTFEKAFQIDSTYAEAAYYLARADNALFEEPKAETWFEKALQIQPDYVECRANYAGMLLDTGSTDKALIQIDRVLTTDPKNYDALRQKSEALRFKALYDDSIKAARQAIQLKPDLAEPYLWLGDSLRLSGKYTDAEDAYIQFLKLSNLNSHLGGQLNYWLLGSFFGMGRKHHAAEADIWKMDRSLGYFGLCDAERKLQHFHSAIPFCTWALKYDSQDALAHYALGLVYEHDAVETGSVAELQPALTHFQQVLTINPDLDEAADSKKNIANIQKFLQGK